jgi:hypothetical protein
MKNLRQQLERCLVQSCEQCKDCEACSISFFEPPTNMSIIRTHYGSEIYFKLLY